MAAGMTIRARGAVIPVTVLGGQIMKLPLQITLRDIPPSEALEGAIREKADKLDQFYPHIMACRVTVGIAGKHKHQGQEFAVAVDLSVPGKEIVVNRDQHEDVYVALRDAFDHARRQLEEFARVHRGEVKAHEVPGRGQIARLFPEEGYGFISAPEAGDLYFSAENVAHPRFEQLEVGMAVSFLPEAGGEGLQAKRVTAARA